MTKGEIEYAERQALNNFDRWNEVSDIPPRFSGYYYEAQSCILDAVHIGIQIALNKEINYDEDGNVVR